MRDLIWPIVSGIIIRIAVKMGADAGEQSLVALARRIVYAQVRTLPASQRTSLGEGIIADFDALATTADKVTFAIQMVPAQLKLHALHGMMRVRDFRRDFSWICKLTGKHSWYHYCNPGLYYCRICGKQAPRWMGAGGYQCDLTVKP